ncbi:MAG: TSUP family transporter [Rhodoferax sp.]
MELLVVALASLFAGFVDAIVGGGGLILIPALFATFPSAHPATLFGTNKGASVWGTGFATWQYSRQVPLPWKALWPAALAGLMASLAGAWLVTRISPEFFRKLLPVLLLAVFAYTLARKDLGRHHQPRFVGAQERWAGAAIGTAIGFYDGFFGPGTGSFLVFLFVRVMGYDFLRASACAKLINTATNVSALALFISKGHIWWHLVLAMAVANVVGSVAGSRLAIRHGSGFVRLAFLLVVSALIAKTGWDALRPVFTAAPTP